jgi:hypothetical protein
MGSSLEDRYRSYLGAAAYRELRAALMALAPHPAADVQPRVGFEPL